MSTMIILISYHTQMITVILCMNYQNLSYNLTKLLYPMIVIIKMVKITRRPDTCRKTKTDHGGSIYFVVKDSQLPEER